MRFERRPISELVTLAGSTGGLVKGVRLGRAIMARASVHGREVAGFTLQELMVTMVVTVLVLTLGIPGFLEALRANRVSTLTEYFVTAMHLARSEAIKQGGSGQVTLCKSADGATCASEGGYHQGWIVFVDEPPLAERDAHNSRERLVQVYEPASVAALTLTGNATVRDYVSYDGTGVARLKGGGFQAGTLTVCDPPQGRRLVLSSGGRIRTDVVKCN